VKKDQGDRGSLFSGAPDIVPPTLKKDMSVVDYVHLLGATSFEARNVHRGARLFERMISEGDTIWLKAISPNWDDELLKQHGDTRIYDIGIRAEETLEAQDRLIREFVAEAWKSELKGRSVSSWEFNLSLGKWVLENAPRPERSFVATAAKVGVPIFWDSTTNHSIAMNLVRCQLEGMEVSLSVQKDIRDSASIAFSAPQTGFLELGGGGPKNFIQQTGPTVSQILGIEFEGADRGLQIGTAVEREGSLSGCTFTESVTWGKYRSAESEKLVQIWAEYSLVFPLLGAYALERCEARAQKRLVESIPSLVEKLVGAYGR
jgi:deoxyhypusine synthase